ncbi:group 1 glycosyl transferase [Sphaerospermopsis kisseleviana NIES-73]|nr:group 1 glycosyl transferase [Sphaerospermopsis kisseleviana NIES-73]
MSMLISYMTGKKKSYANNLRAFKYAKENNWFAKEHNLVNKFTVLYSGNIGSVSRYGHHSGNC